MAEPTRSIFDPSSCPKLSEFGLDHDIERIFNRSMITHQNLTSEIRQIEDPLTERGAVRWWTIHYGVLFFAACDSARVLATHNLAREAWVHQRQAFEYLIRSIYMVEHPDKALMEIRAEPLRRLKLLENYGEKSGSRHDGLKKHADDAIRAWPAIKSFALPPLEQMVPNEKNERDALYTKHYRVPSITTHGTVLSIARVMKREGGIIETGFDSRTKPWELNDLFGTLCTYILIHVQVTADRVPRSGV